MRDLNPSKSFVDDVTGIVRAVLARHASHGLRTVRAWQHLERDLDLTPLELVIICFEIEDAVDVVLPAEGLALVESVGDLVAFVALAVEQDRRCQVVHSVA
jgi:acyl carrier protein